MVSLVLVVTLLQSCVYYGRVYYSGFDNDEIVILPPSQDLWSARIGIRIVGILGASGCRRWNSVQLSLAFFVILLCSFQLDSSLGCPLQCHEHLNQKSLLR